MSKRKDGKPRGQSAHDCELVPRGFFDHLGRDEQQHYDHVEDGQHYQPRHIQ